MNRKLITTALLVALIALPVAAAPPPLRPLPLTQRQFEALRQIESQPQHAAAREVHATYQSERQREMEKVRAVDDATTAATFSGMIGAIVTILIMGVF